MSVDTDTVLIILGAVVPLIGLLAIAYIFRPTSWNPYPFAREIVSGLALEAAIIALMFLIFVGLTIWALW